MSDLTASQEHGLAVARAMVAAGIPVFIAARNHGSGHEFLLPKSWQTTKPNPEVIDRWRPGMALCAVMGVVCDGADTDPRNGGAESRADLVAAGVWPKVYGVVKTPSEGTHEYIHRTHVAKGELVKGVDLQAGQDDGEGRGFLYLPPTERVSKWGDHEGAMVEYAWEVDLDVDYLTDWSEEGDGTTEGLANLMRNKRASRRAAPKRTRGEAVATEDDDPFDTAYSSWDEASAMRAVEIQLKAVEAAREGAINNALGGAARMMGRFVGALFTEDEAAAMLLEALTKGGVHSDSWNVANGKSWTAATVIQSALSRGQEEPWDVMLAPEVVEAGLDATEAPRAVMPSPDRPGQSVPDLEVGSAAEMTYWLQGFLGAGSLSGFFSRGGQVVHTPRVDEMGYVAPPGDQDENGPAQIQAVSPGQLTAKVQYAHRCYRMADVKDQDGKKTGEKVEVPALFPLEAAKRATDAPEAMVMLRPLRGVTHTPMVRADGSVLATPGYDRESGYLFLPGPGVSVPAVSDAPSASEVESAVALLDEMVAGFPWVSKDDKANYYGLLITPLLRMLAPPSYKGFFIGAHQPGSGKTLLADVEREIHGGVFRSELPPDEKEMKSMTTALLATTSAPVVHIDNVTGVLRSAVLAGLLTSSGEVQERELGKSSNLTFTNDRVWVFTGNNPSLGGDMVRRTVTIMIDPNMANPESRSFAIQDLPAWVRTNRNRLLHALLTLVRNWVALGSVPAVRAQSDSFATWEATVAGILHAAGVPGDFDQDSGKRAAAGGDDDGLAFLLEHVYESHESKPWTVAELLTAEPDEFRADAREWLPSSILDRLQRSEAGGRKSLGRWLMNRMGRWVTTDEGVSFVIREAGKNRNKVAQWRVEVRPPAA